MANNAQMGYTLRGMVCGKKDYFSKKKNEQVYQLDVYDGNTVVPVGGVPADIWASIQSGETLGFDCRVSAFVDNGRARMIVTFQKLA